MTSLLLSLSLGLIVLLISTEFIVKNAVRLSLAIRISPLVVGITVVAIGTSLPELVVSGLATAVGDTGLAIGNLVGSNVANVLLVLGVTILGGRLRVGTTKTQRSIIVLLGVSILFVFLHLARVSSITSGIVLLGLAVLVTVVEYVWGTQGRRREDRYRFNGRKHNTRVTRGMIAGLALALIGIVYGGISTVSSIEQLAAMTGYSTTALGLTLVAVATSLPELLASLVSERNRQEKLALGNLIGSNIYNLLFIGGLVSASSPSRIGSGIPTMIWAELLLSTVVLVIIVRRYRGSVIPNKIGVMLLALFGLYVASITRDASR